MINVKPSAANHYMPTPSVTPQPSSLAHPGNQGGSEAAKSSHGNANSAADNHVSTSSKLLSLSAPLVGERTGLQRMYGSSLNSGLLQLGDVNSGKVVMAQCYSKPQADTEPTAEPKSNGETKPAADQPISDGDTKPVTTKPKPSGYKTPLTDRLKPRGGTKEPVVEQPKASGTKEPVVEQPKASGTKEPVVEQPKASGTKEPVVEQPKASGTKEPVVEQPKASGTKEPVVEQPKASGTKEPVAEQPKASGTKEPVVEQPKASGTKEPAVEQPKAGGDTRTDDTTYGFNSNTGRLETTLTSASDKPKFNIWDQRGNDTFDFSGFKQDQIIDLRGGALSSVGGMRENVRIGEKTVIENAVGGHGNDRIIGNSADNVLTGGAGADTLVGGEGWNTFKFNAFSDSTRANADLLLDFKTGQDKIDLSQMALDGKVTLNFVDNYTGAAGDTIIKFNPQTGRYLLATDLDGDGKTDFLIKSTRMISPEDVIGLNIKEGGYL
ncbi:M10 family metallopeptidase C-terminal domain-containing protein [Pseudomonas sp. FP215]|uniref:M10 family metallopeptidase C-terminal domain-containing protein n=1 Tax=Pseudomonas sp. FP215 TaxID=2738126 RepID=UPI002732397D|nr:M10 family metallopeptidase C-terminal domain-containing protein [Pseudomonas sp. FP215]WLH22089.1 M10 family metallopeptidase C-terminal domain-containing protein [Pseudomonas sp. FP215]